MAPFQSANVTFAIPHHPDPTFAVGIPFAEFVAIVSELDRVVDVERDLRRRMEFVELRVLEDGFRHNCNGRTPAECLNCVSGEWVCR